MNCLGNDILSAVFTFLPMTSLISSLSRVCKRWNFVIKSRFPNLKEHIMLQTVTLIFSAEQYQKTLDESGFLKWAPEAIGKLWFSCDYCGETQKFTQLSKTCLHQFPEKSSQSKQGKLKDCFQLNCCSLCDVALNPPLPKVPQNEQDSKQTRIVSRGNFIDDPTFLCQCFPSSCWVFPKAVRGQITLSLVRFWMNDCIIHIQSFPENFGSLMDWVPFHCDHVLTFRFFSDEDKSWMSDLKVRCGWLACVSPANTRFGQVANFSLSWVEEGDVPQLRPCSSFGCVEEFLASQAAFSSKKHSNELPFSFVWRIDNQLLIWPFQRHRSMVVSNDGRVIVGGTFG